MSGIGMMWFDNDKKSDLGKKIDRAADYFKVKYGATAKVITVHPSMTELTEVNGIKIETSRSILPNHFYVGTGK